MSVALSKIEQGTVDAETDPRLMVKGALIEVILATSVIVVANPIPRGGVSKETIAANLLSMIKIVADKGLFAGAESVSTIGSGEG